MIFVTVKNKIYIESTGFMLRFLYLICLILVCPISTLAVDTVAHKGIIYDLLSDNTVLLDAEDIYGCDKACKTPEEAFNRVNRNGKNVTLLVAPSVYWLDDPDDPNVRTDKGGTPYAVRIKCDTLSIIGLSENPEDIVFAVNRGQTQGAVGNFTMFHFKGEALTVKDITFGNYANVDLVYPRNPKLNRNKRKDAIVQAQIGICDGTDRLYADNCRFISRLNLCPFVGARRSLYDNCYFECTDDALSGSAVYLDCRFTFFSSKPFYSTAETGAVFLNCDITCKGDGVQYFTKVPGQVTAIDTRFYSDNPIEIKWTRDVSDVVCRQENISLNGQPYIIDKERPALGPEFGNSRLRDAYVVDHGSKKYYNLPNLLNGEDGWDPKDMNGEISKLASEKKTKLTGLPVALRISSESPKYITDGDKVTVRSTQLLWGGYPVGKEDVFTYIAENKLPVERAVEIPVSAPGGLTVRYSMSIEPKLRKAPKFKKKPLIKFDENSQCFFVDYVLSGKGEDDGDILWGRLVNDGDSTKFLTLTDNKAPLGKFYRAKAGDFAYGIVAIVFPKYRDSESGMPEASQVFEIVDPSQVQEMPESNLITDFSDVAIERRTPGFPGAWSFDVFKPADTSLAEWQPTDGPGWYYGKGFDASTGEGLVQKEKGARISYVPARDACHNMTAHIVAEPAKSGGQGFGSATSQYMDICIKFDPVSLNGYALRIERTPDHDRAVRFCLIKYEDGKTSVISDEIISNCFRNPCFITVGINDGILSASAYTDAPEQKGKCCDEVVDRVELSIPVEDNTLTGFCIQHTGSTGPSSTLLRDLNINWQ